MAPLFLGAHQVVALISLAFALLVCLNGQWLGQRLSVMDVADADRKRHAAPTPLVGGIAILGVGVLSMFGLFGGFHVGTIISGAIVALMCGYILYETSLIMHHLPTTAHVAGAMMIFGSIAQLFRHILFLLMRFGDD